MQRKTLWFTFWILVFTFTSAYAAEPGNENHLGPQSGFKPHRFVTGTVSRIKNGVILLKMGKEREREFSIKEAHVEKIKGLKVGDRIILELSQGDQIIEIIRANKRGIKDSEAEPLMVKGEVIGFKPVKKVVNLKLEDTGELRSYRMNHAAATRMKDIKRGTRVLLEIDQVNDRVEDFYVY